MTNAHILANPAEAKDTLFLTGQVELNQTMYHISISADGPAIAQSAENMEGLPRKKWDNPEERASMGIDANIRLLGAGGILSVTTNNAPEPRMFLVEKTAGPSKGKLKEPAGLCDINPILAAYMEIAEETGLTIIDGQAQTVSLILPEPPLSALEHAFDVGKKESEIAEKDANITAFLDSLKAAKQAQVEYIRSQLPQHAQNWPIEITTHPLKESPEDSPYAHNILIETEIPTSPGIYDTHALSAIVSDNIETANFNILLPVRLHFDLTEGQTLHPVDPENFGDPSPRPVHMVPRSDMLTAEFIKDKASVTMGPFLNRAFASETEPKIPTNLSNTLRSDIR